MKIFRSKISSLFILTFLFVLAMGTFFGNGLAMAATCGTGEGGVQTSFDFGCPAGTDANAKTLDNNPIYRVLLYIVDAVSAGAGVVIVGGIIWQSFQYATANGSADKVKNAKNNIVNAVIALILFVGMFSILNFLIPGGVFAG